MATVVDIKVNDFVKIDGKDGGRVLSVVQPLGTYRMFNVKINTGQVRHVAGYRLTKVPETVSSTSGLSSNPTFNIPDEVYNDLLRDDFFDDSHNDLEFQPRYDHSGIDKFVQGNQNKNTLRKTNYDVKRLFAFMATNGDTRPIESIDKSELCDILCTFFISLRNPDGSNYEPSSLRGMLSSIERYLKSKHYSTSLFSDGTFVKLHDVLKTKQKLLKSEGMGNLPRRAESLSDDDINKLWECDQLFPNTPESILNTLWWNNTVHFGIRSVKPHNGMRWGDVSLHVDNEGKEFLQFRERQSKTYQGDNLDHARNIYPKAWATNDERCPVNLYKRFADLRPSDYSSPDSPFYLATNCKDASHSHPWFKRQPVGVNKLGTIMKRMAKSAGLDNRRFTNHSARKYLVQKLADQNIPPTEIMQISGHRNVQSINSYSNISMDRHRAISNILSSNNDQPGSLVPPSHIAAASASELPSTVNVTSSQSRNAVTCFGSLHSIFLAPI
ncbi:uncharacterized protein LOC115217879 [Octopus sinensis]|uniref:Uncharacterized protein LOC115217879 n=1 Tax=Octopus sinensis TaxID=2607531 RepID=A0A6P7T0B6_9MOLL|nr:uncharacterized protein LOC115217879 [Octopus sinensis]